MYPLPIKLSAEIWTILCQSGIDLTIDDDNEEKLYTKIAALLVRENRLLRQQVASLMRDFAAAAENDETDYDATMAAACGAETCQHIIDEFLRDRVYFNSEEARQRAEEVERVIKDMWEDYDDRS